MDSELHNRAVSLQPEVLPLKRYWISILLHHAQEKPLTALVNDDFLWIKGAKKITVSKLKDEYVKRNNVDFDLRFGNEILQGVTTVGALDFLKDRCIVLRAVPKNEEEDPPLQQPSSSSAAHREPLQPTNRQIQVPSPTTNGPRKPSYPKGLSWKPPLPDPAAVNGRQNASWTAPLPSPASAPTHWKSSSPSRYRTASPYENLYPANLRMHPYPAATRYSGPNAYSGSNSSPLAYPAQPGDPSPVPGQEATPTPLSLAKPVAGIFQGETQDDADAMSPPEEPTPTPPPLPPQNLHLQKLLDVNGDYPVEILEDGVSRGVELLRGFQDSMKSKAELSRDATQWLTQIETLREKAVKGRTVIGVVGNTGAGKSSVINAMLDEERLVPTNCMRACTAVVTEISWNDSEDPAQLYRAQIEFIKAADWEKELSILFKDLVDSDGQVYKESSNADSDAGVAYAKIKAVYPHLTKDMIADSSVAKLMRHPAVQNVLGTTKKIVQQQCGKFYKSLQQYVDSKEKLSKEEKESQKKEKGPKKPEFWPLIRIVKIFTKAAALSTGAVIVDLPGVQDSNTARAAVAEGYMKQCTGLWIVAPITRAVDDKAAKNLLGQQFKRQLKYDGTYGNVTFICSKTDDISITEAADSLDMDEQISEAYSESQDLEAEIKRLEDDNDELLKSREKYTDILEETTTQLEQWKELEEKLDSGKNVFAPREKKRKRTKDHKRRNRDLFDSQDLDSDSDDASAIESENDDEIEELPLTAEQISSKLEALKEQKADAKREKEGIVDRRKTTRKRLQEAKAKLSNLKSEMSAVCIAGRNKYSKTAIQQDFAAGVKELDQEKASEEDEASFNPDEDLRDYDEIARSLPVFCVSSRAYQKLSGRLEKDSSVSGFTEAGQTGVPQLQDHCRKLTESGRAAGARAFLNLLSQFFNSLALWSSDTNSSRFMTTSQSEARQAFLDDQLQNLDQNLSKALKDCLGEMAKNFEESIYDHYPSAVTHASAQAVQISDQWGAHRDYGGLHWGTYKAIVRRDGRYTNAKGLHDFNGQLTEPIMKHLGSGWGKAFQRRLPIILKGFTVNAARIMREFHEVIETEARLQGIGIAGMNMLSQQLNNYTATLKDVADQMIVVIAEMQRNANREFVPVVQSHMLPAYEVCTDERGPGSFKRMKDAMRVHINSQQGTMFRDATSTVKKHLDGILDALRQQMEQQTRYVTSAMRRDYQEVFGGQCQARRPTPEVEADIALKSDIKGQIKGTHEVFRKLIGAPTPEPEDHSGTPENREELEDADAKVDEEVKDEDDPNAAESAMVEDDAPMMEIPVAPAEHESAANIAPELEEQFDDRVADRSTDGPGEAVNPESALSPVKSEPPKQADATMEDASNLELVTEMPQAKLEDAPTADTPIYTADVEQPLNASETLAEAVDDAAAALVDS